MQPQADSEIVYRESDGEPMGESTIHIDWIMTLLAGFRAVFRGRPDVFVAGDLFWYPVRGRPGICQAPDVLVAFGRPPGHRSSYRQWDEDDVAPQVAIEVLSSSDTLRHLARVHRFYQRYRVEEFYTYDPITYQLQVWQRSRRRLSQVLDRPVNGFVSPRTGVRFVVPGGEPMTVFGPDGKPFLTIDELRNAVTDQEQRADQEKQRADALAAKLRALGVDPDAV